LVDCRLPVLMRPTAAPRPLLSTLRCVYAADCAGAAETTAFCAP
jgi:hypothetical protein